MESRGRGVLDTPPARGMTSQLWGANSNPVVASEAKQSSVQERLPVWTPLPNPPPQGGRERTAIAAIAYSSLPHSPASHLYSLFATHYSPTSYFIPSTNLIACAIASSVADALPSTDCRFSPGSSKLWVAPW
jgi:hypothetical protein